MSDISYCFSILYGYLCGLYLTDRWQVTNSAWRYLKHFILKLWTSCFSTLSLLLTIFWDFFIWSWYWSISCFDFILSGSWNCFGVLCCFFSVGFWNCHVLWSLLRRLDTAGACGKGFTYSIILLLPMRVTQMWSCRWCLCRSCQAVASLGLCLHLHHSSSGICTDPLHLSIPCCCCPGCSLRLW